MIMRVFQVIVKPGKEAAFGKFFHEVAIPMMREVPGLVQVFPGAPRPTSPRAFCFVMMWESLEALKAFAGEEYTQPHIDPAEADLVESREISHFDLVAV
ncbi:putative quinol monooxygenase [Roseovarius sp. C7]|uniref:putative quinol monooxygenase n=1 Tax=Roseovarius sp. C7 TaxID=3398643 RepID=UPI0039F6FBE6